MKALTGILLVMLLSTAAKAQTCEVKCVAIKSGQDVNTDKNLPEFKEFTLEISLDTANVLKISSEKGLVIFKAAEVAKYKKAEVKFKFNNLADQEHYDKPAEFNHPVRISDICGKRLIVKSRW